MPSTALTSSRRFSLKTRILATFLALGLGAIALTGLQTFRIADAALEEATYARLTGIRETKKRQIETFFRDTLSIVETLAHGESATDSVLGFEAVWQEVAWTAGGALPAVEQALRRHYANQVLPALANSLSGPVPLEGLWPATAAGKMLQGIYTVRIAGAGARDYQAVHELHHDSLAGFADTFGFDDLLLIDSESGTVLYSVRKGPDLGVSLSQPAYAESNLSEAFRRAIESPGRARVVDFAPYAGANGGPAAFAAAAVRDHGAAIGVLAVRLSVDKIDEVMTGGGNWRQEGLGETGETYLVGSDRLMRSDSRFQMEDQETYLRQLLQYGYEPAVVERIRAGGSSILIQQVHTGAVERALRGEAATSRIIDYRGVPVLSSFTPLDLPELDWVLLSEIDVAEAFAPVSSLRRNIAGLALLISAAYLALGYIFARRITRPLDALTANVERLGRGGLNKPLSLEPFTGAGGEIARLAQTFQDLTERLRATLVSRDYLDDLLESMINAVFVLFGVGPDAASARNAVIHSANPAACRLLGYEVGELSGRPIRDILADHDGGTPLLEVLLRDRSLPAFETALIARSGRRIPVLFTAAFLKGADGASPDVVCVAQDITERKTAEEDLRASRKQLRELAGRLLSTQESERSRLARELHDDVTQRLALLAIEAGKIGRQQGLSAESHEKLQRLKQQIATLSDDIHALSRRLHPSILEDLGLAPALRAECRRYSENLGIPIACAVEEPPAEPPRDLALTFYRIAQESLRNIARHAEASEVNVELSFAAGRARLLIEDNGRGFDPAEARGKGGLGLASMEERAYLIGGRLTIRSQKGEGTTITIEAPLSQST